MDDESNQVLKAVAALHADGVTIEPMGDDFDFRLVGAFSMTDAEVIRLVESRGRIDRDGERGSPAHAEGPIAPRRSTTLGHPHTPAGSSHVRAIDCH